MTRKFDFYSRVVKFSGRSVNLIIESQSLSGHDRVRLRVISGIRADHGLRITISCLYQM